MNKPSHNKDVRQATFIEELSGSLRKAAKTVCDNKRFATLAQSYREDGLDDVECVELLMIDGLTREAAESCVVMVDNDIDGTSDLDEYGFQFEDEKGRVWSSYDINKTVRASSDEDAFIRAEECFVADDSDVRITSVTRI